jgi:hypothetical protein
MTIYLKNDICEFETLFDLNLQKKVNIITTCFFKMGNHYKNINKYIDGLKKIVKLINSQNVYMLRIFIDQNVKDDKDIFNLLTSNNKIQIVLFKCLKYMKSSYHIDVFATLVRLFPIFNFENNDSKQVIVIDIDLHDDDIDKLVNAMNYKTNNQEIISMGTTEKLLVKHEKPHFFCGLTSYLNVKFDKELIINFIHDAHLIKDTGFYEKRLAPFGFGVDELFLNKYLIFNKHNRLMKNTKLGIIFQYNVNWFIYYHMDLLKKKPMQTYNNLKLILGKYYKSTYKLDDLFNIIDKIIYGFHAKTYNKNVNVYARQYISARFYKLLQFNQKTNKYWLPKETTQFINKYMNKIVWSISYVYFDINTFKPYYVRHINQIYIKNKQLLETSINSGMLSNTIKIANSKIANSSRLYLKTMKHKTFKSTKSNKTSSIIDPLKSISALTKTTLTYIKSLLKIQ